MESTGIESGALGGGRREKKERRKKKEKQQNAQETWRFCGGAREFTGEVVSAGVLH